MKKDSGIVTSILGAAAFGAFVVLIVMARAFTEATTKKLEIAPNTPAKI